MHQLNKIMVTGRLTNDPHALEYTSTGTAYCRFRVAVDSGFGERKSVIYMSVTAWGKSAEWCANWLKKGTGVYIEGRVEEEKWESEKTNTKHEKFRISTLEVQFAESKRDADARNERRDDQGASEEERPNARPIRALDDLPF